MSVGFRAPIAALVVFALVAPSAAVAPANPSGLEKPIKVVIGAIRYKKDPLALKQLALAEMSQALCASHWGKLSAAEQKEFSSGLATLLQKISFPKARDLFQHIDAILYGKPAIDGQKAKVRSTIVVHRAYKKKELVIDWVLVRQKKDWLIVDTITAGESTVQGIREDEVEPLVKKGGVKLLMQKLREKVAEVSKS